MRRGSPAPGGTNRSAVDSTVNENVSDSWKPAATATRRARSTTRSCSVRTTVAVGSVADSGCAVTVNPGNFFDQIDFAREIPTRRGRLPGGAMSRLMAFEFQSQCLEDFQTTDLGDIDADNPGDPGEPEGDGCWSRLIRLLNERDGFFQLSAGCLKNEFATASTGPVELGEIDSTFVAIGRRLCRFRARASRGSRLEETRRTR